MKVTYIELLGERHPLCFSLSAIEDICDTFGSVEDMQTLLFDDTNTSAKLKTVGKLLDILVKAGRRYFKLAGKELPPEIKGNLADLIDISDPGSITKVFEAINGDAEREIEARPSKNAEAAQE